MELTIPIGTKLDKKRVVTSDDTATQYGSGLAEVFATPAMIALMEQTAYMSIESFLPKGYSSVGISVNVQHTKATLPGREVHCQSEVTKVEGKRVYFSISVYDDSGKVGEAEHVRYVIDSEEFIARLK